MVELDDLIARARALPPMTEAELRAQSDSFVRAEMAWGSDADEAAYRAAWEAADWPEMDRLAAEAQARVAAFDRIRGQK